MSKRIVFSLVMLPLGGCQSDTMTTPVPIWTETPALAPPFYSSNDRVPFASTLYSICTWEEVIDVTGWMHIVSHARQTATGTVTRHHFNTQGVSGIGRNTGARYEFMQVDNQALEFEAATPTFDIVDRFKYRYTAQGVLSDESVSASVWIHFDETSGYQVTIKFDTSCS